MAARENQGYLIAVIILVLLTLVLALAAFLGISKASEYADNMAKADADLQLAQKLAEAHQTKSQILEAYIGGLGPSVAEVQTMMDSLDRTKNALDADQRTEVDNIIGRVREIRTEYDNDMKQFIASDDEDQAQEFTWRSLAQNLSAVVSKKHIETNVLRNDINRIQREADAEIAAKQKEVDETSAALTDARTELQGERERHDAEEKKYTASLNAVKESNRQSLETLEKNTADFNRTKNQLQGVIETVSKENATLKEKVDRYEQETFDLPDGQVVRATPDTVWINLGYSDGLRANRTFSVYDSGITNFEEGRHKATIEITRILSAHQAEGKVTSQDRLDPILQGDFVLTPTWDPGYSVPIAIVGMIDLDGDGNSDRQKLVQMIKKNGGTVVAMHDDEGNVTGRIDSATRYLVLGTAPQPNPETPPALLSAIDTLIDQAKSNSVQQIDVKKLLNWMGIHGRAKVERLDNRIGEEFRQRTPLDTLKGADR